MSYRNLYEYCQTLEPKVRRNAIKNKALELTGAEKVRVVKTRILDPEICRGFFVSSASKRASCLGAGNLIILASDLNYCWERFVYAKELMHLFDKPEEKTSSGEQYERLIQELTLPRLEERSPQTISDTKGFWMALGVLCPEKHRIELVKQREEGSTNMYDIATKLRIPQQYVPLLLDSDYLTKISHILKEDDC